MLIPVVQVDMQTCQPARTREPGRNNFDSRKSLFVKKCKKWEERNIADNNLMKYF